MVLFNDMNQRDLKIRVWGEQGGRFLKLSDGFRFDIEGRLWSNIPNTESIDESEFVIQQYSGMSDKNGKEIYEGDILEWGMSYDHTPFPKLRFVEFYLPQLIYKAVEVGDSPVSVEYLFEAAPNSTRWCKVIGNIFENPELLNL